MFGYLKIKRGACIPFRLRFFLLCLTLLLFPAALSVSSGNTATQSPSVPKASGHGNQTAPYFSGSPIAPNFDPANADTYVVAEFTFDNGSGGADPQGWFPIDFTQQSGVYWHVDNYRVPVGGGSKCAWCGVASNASGSTCYYDCPPGYGNSWDQIFEMPSPVVTHGDVTLSYLVSWDTEPSYDFWHVQYLNKSNQWVDLAVVDGTGSNLPRSHLISKTALNGSVRFRFRMLSDGTYSDEDCLYDSHGAIQLDNIQIADSTGILHFENFENETLGSTTTDDGVWVARGPTPYGNFADLFAGNEVVQLDPQYHNDGHFWAFLRGSTDVNAGFCPDPDSLIIPFSKWLDGKEENLDNVACSPVIDWTVDKNGLPIPYNATITLLQFRVYRDMDPNQNNNVVFYKWHVRTFERGSPCVEAKWLNTSLYWGSQKDWYDFSVEISSLIPEGHDRIQIALGAIDLCATHCNLTEPLCHTQAPFFDDVRIIRVDTTTVETGIDEGKGGLPINRLMTSYPNPFNASTTIHYSIAAPGLVDVKIYDVSGKLVRTLFHGYQKPNPAGFYAKWDSRAYSGEAVSAGVYFCELKVADFRQVKKLVIIK
jgi:hypothetical protein